MHVAIILPRWVGDLVMATPMIRAVRQHLGSDAQLTAVVKPLFRELLEGTNWFDQFIGYDRRSRDPTIRFSAAAAALRADPVDVALLVPNSLSSAALAWWGRCRRRVGYARHGRRLLLTDPLWPTRRGWRVEPVSTTQHAMDLAERIGVPVPGTNFYPTILGGVIFGIGIALYIERYGYTKNIRGLGLGGAIAINICGGMVLLIWLLVNPFELPMRGYIVLWTIALLVLLVGIIEMFAKSWRY